jgi:hypothetical protein
VDQEDQYRRLAWDWLQMAEATNDLKSRLVLLRMAQAVVHLAEEAEKNSKLDIGYAPPPGFAWEGEPTSSFDVL